MSSPGVEVGLEAGMAEIEALLPETDPVMSAEAAGLHYVDDSRPGIRREPSGDGFIYIRPGGQPVSRQSELERIRSIVIPPAWTDVWICPDPNGHIQAIGRDARGRKQYRYHPRWRQARDETKYHRLVPFGRTLPIIRERINRDMARPGLSRERVLATVVKLLEVTLIRIGNEEYARQNQSFGLTTLRDRHVEVEGSRIVFHFRGKSGREHTIDVRDRRLARIIQRCQDLPGQELFQYVDQEGNRHSISSADVNDYLREISGFDFTAKDFRTWAGTVLVVSALRELEPFTSQAQANKNIVQAIDLVSSALGNTRAVCRRCYVHPVVLDSYLEGSLLEALTAQEAELLEGLEPEEAAVLRFLEARLTAAEAGSQTENTSSAGGSG